MNNRQRVIAILTHVSDEFHQSPRLIHQFIPCWEAMGFKVVVTNDAGPFVPADLAVLHVDLSVIPDSIRLLMERYPKVLNGGVLDIRKRAHSPRLVNRDGPDPGNVIVKSDWNYGGERDFRLRLYNSVPARMLRPLGLDDAWCRRQIRHEAKRPWTQRAWLTPNGYQVYKSRAEVPVEVWANPNLIVEKFISEYEGPNYCCRHWLFFGNREVSRRTVSSNPVVKGEGKIEPLSEPIPGELRAIRRKLGFDYGKFDYVIVDGRVILYDTNRTPGITSNPQRHAQTVDVLSQGILDFLKT